VPAPVSPAPAPCAGDCSHDGNVSLDELIAGVRLLLGDPGLSCAALDSDTDGTVRVDELIRAVDSAIAGCTLGE
jgi:hypothetical protein